MPRKEPLVRRALIKEPVYTLKLKVAQLCLTLCDPLDLTVCGTFQARILEWVAFPFSRGSTQSRDQTQVSHIAGRFFTSWATGKPRNTGVGSLSLLQWIFPIQVLNRGLLHCRWIFFFFFYQLSYQGSLKDCEVTFSFQWNINSLRSVTSCLWLYFILSLMLGTE